MFSKQTKSTIGTLVGADTRIDGDIHFKGGLRIDGHVRGNVIADPLAGAMLIISENAKVDGEVRGAHLVINGEINGAVVSTELLEMHGGAIVAGRLTPATDAEPVLKLASSKT
jgi:cytoskeletal protein CcmA (bactofilin family)